MITFVLVAAVMIAIAVACVLVPLLRGGKPAGVALEASNVEILRDQLAELDADLASGAMPRERFDEARRELEQRALEDSKATEAAGAPPSQSAAWTAAILAGAIPVVALVLYVALGNFDAFAPAGSRVAREAAGSEHELTREQVDAMAAKLAQKLEREPDNAEGWSMLARTYYALNRYNDAVPAFERATTLLPNDAGLLADYADAVGAIDGGLHGRAQALIARALAADPTQWKALALAGTAAFERKEYAKAADYWERTKASVPPSSPLASSIDSSIAEARQLGGLPAAAQAMPPQIAAAPAAGGAKGSAASPPSSAGGGGGAAAATARIAGTVTLAPALAAKAAPTDTVFIFARAAEGPKMPLAILRKQVKDLPVAFTLDDSMAMAPNFALSKFPSVVVGARVSKSGNAAPQTGDLEGFSPAVRIGATGLTVVIDRTLP